MQTWQEKRIGTMIKAVIFDMYETLISHYRCPLYFSSQMSEDIGIAESDFRKIWNATDEDRSLGKLSFEDVIERILRENDKYSEELFHKVVDRRKNTKVECFKNLHGEIMPMLDGIRENGLKIGLITNCFSEEAEVIKKSEMFKYFDAACLSCEEGVRKPDLEIFRRCLERLEVMASECVFIGDGGSFELETAESLGMTIRQAVWYLKDGMPEKRKNEFKHLENPLDVLKIVE